MVQNSATQDEVRLDRQWAFDTALAGLRKQGRKSDDGDSCLYRGPSGTRCGVGFLIPDERYNDDLEGTAADHKQVMEAVLPGLGKNGGDAGDAGFLWAIQSRLHDRLDLELSGLEPAAVEFASLYGLTYTAPVEGAPA